MMEVRTAVSLGLGVIAEWERSTRDVMSLDLGR
jgi:hypothetical protein